MNKIFFILTLPYLLAWSSVSIYGPPRYKENSTHLSYANPLASKGGILHLGVNGNFDTLNPYSLRGQEAWYLNLVFQTLGQKTLDDADSFYPQVAEDFLLAPDRM